MKDNFSSVSPQYAQFRPAYPAELYDYLLGLVPARETAWDCGTGNGQVAAGLAGYFDKIFATDISQNQLRNAVKKENISYSIQSAERTTFPDNQFDLIIAAQAVHWFDFTKFFPEVNRTLRGNGIIAVVGYSHVEFHTGIDRIISRLKNDILQSYWDKERRYVDEHYATIPFPFSEIQFPVMSMRYSWSLEQLLGYLHTWSAVQHYRERNNADPVALVANEIEQQWDAGGSMTAIFPLFARVGKKIHSPTGKK